MVRVKVPFRDPRATETLTVSNLPVSRVTIAPLNKLCSTDAAPSPAPSGEARHVTAAPSDLAQRVLEGDPEAIEALAQLVQLCATGGEGYIDPTSLVEGVLAARVNARANGQYDLADALRDSFLKSGIDVQDTPDGTTWSLRAEK